MCKLSSWAYKYGTCLAMKLGSYDTTLLQTLFYWLGCKIFTYGCFIITICFYCEHYSRVEAWLHTTKVQS